MPDKPDLLPISQPCGILYPSSPSLSISVQSDEKAAFSQNSPSVLRDCRAVPGAEIALWEQSSLVVLGQVQL